MSGTDEASDAHVVTHGDPRRYTVALTFDLVDDAGEAAQLLDLLRARAVVATVFAAGSWVTVNDAAARRIRADGHELGNLAVPGGTGGNTDSAALVEAIVAGDRALQPVIGAPTGWLRIQGTSAPSTSWRRAAAAAGHTIVVGSDVSMPDATTSSTEDVVSTVNVGVRPGAIVALDLTSSTVAALPAILDHLLVRDLQPVSIGEMLRYSPPAP